MWIMPQRSNDSDEELQEAPTKRPKVWCSVSRQFGVASTHKNKFLKAILQTPKRATITLLAFSVLLEKES